MAGSMVEDKAQAKAEQCRERITEQESSGLPVKQFCHQRGLSSWSFYRWRKELRETASVRFALVERNIRNQDGVTNGDLELVFASGERLRIRPGVDGATLRAVVDALRR